MARCRFCFFPRGDQTSFFTFNDRFSRTKRHQLIQHKLLQLFGGLWREIERGGGRKEAKSGEWPQSEKGWEKKKSDKVLAVGSDLLVLLAVSPTRSAPSSLLVSLALA